jgi:hypothetical protein
MTYFTVPTPRAGGYFSVLEDHQTANVTHPCPVGGHGHEVKSHAEPQEVPLLDADRLVPWIYGGSAAVQVVAEGHRYVDLPGAAQLAQLLAVAQTGGYEWVLLDGPRAMRATWVLDPWWTERPELSEKIIKDTNAGCVPCDRLLAALERR